MCLLILAPFSRALAQTSDSLTYQLQRKKINTLLEQRSQKFSQYTQSLDQHTGIFGWQTKKDIKRSGEILMDIVRTDDNIFNELKILFDFKNYQQTQVQQHSTDDEGRIAGLMLTINKLRQQNELLIKEQKEQEDTYQSRQLKFIIFIILLVIASFFLLNRRNNNLKL